MSDYSIDSDYRFALLQSEKVRDRLSKVLADKTYIKSTLGSYISLDDIGVSSRSDLVKALLICIAYHHYSCVVVLSPNRKSDKPIAEAHLNSIDILDGLIFQIKLGSLSCHTNVELSILKFAKGDQSNEYEAYKKLKAMEASDNLKDTIIDTHEFYKQLESLPRNEQYFPQAFKILNIDPIYFNERYDKMNKTLDGTRSNQPDRETWKKARRRDMLTAVMFVAFPLVLGLLSLYLADPASLGWDVPLDTYTKLLFFSALWLCIAIPVTFPYFRDSFKHRHKVVKLLRNKAEGGDVQAQLELGEIYTSGKSVPPDTTEAAKWYRKAADQGDTRAQSFLGYCYSVGQGVPEDVVLAYMWCSIASDNVWRDELMTRMTPKQIAEAQELRREWTANYERR